MTDLETKAAICAVSVLNNLCKNQTKCNDCLFYINDNDEWTGCMFEGDIPDGWDVSRYDKK